MGYTKRYPQPTALLTGDCSGRIVTTEDTNRTTAPPLNTTVRRLRNNNEARTRKDKKWARSAIFSICSSFCPACVAPHTMSRLCVRRGSDVSTKHPAYCCLQWNCTGYWKTRLKSNIYSLAGSIFVFWCWFIWAFFAVAVNYNDDSSKKQNKELKDAKNCCAEFSSGVGWWLPAGLPLQMTSFRLHGAIWHFISM